MTPGISGGGTTKVLLLSESHEDQSHFLLERLIRRAGFQKDHFYFGQATNPDVLHEAARLGVKVVMPLGERALRFATGEPGIGRWRGRVITSATGMFTLPTFRPSRLFYRRVPKGAPPDPETLRNPPRYQKSFLRDLHYGVYVAKNGFERQPVKYLLDPSAEEFWLWVKGFAEAATRNPELLLSYDIETPYKQEVVEEDELEESEAASDLNTHILRISFSYETHTGVTIPYLPQYHEAIGALLSHPCGKVGWNCPLASERVLTADLRWIPAGELCVGDRLVGFDEEIPGHRQRRKYRTSEVTHIGRHTGLAFRVTFSDGSSVSVSAEHPWLTANTGGNGANYRWTPTNELAIGARVPRFFNPWKTDTSYEAGWFAGMLDGEGSLSRMNPHKAVGRYNISVSQKEGPTWDRLCEVATQLGVEHTTGNATKNPDSKNRHQRYLRVASADTARVLGTVRPHRLLEKFSPECLGAVQATSAAGRDVFVTAIEDLGLQEIVELSTSTHTYVLEGFGAHNCVYFDTPVLEANGYRIEGPVFDGMDAWHFLHPQLDKGLEAVTADATDMLPWKHLSDSNPEWYSATDADAALRNVLYTHEKLKAQGAWETYLQSVVEVMTYMKEAGQRGTPLDISKQQELIPLLDAETERLEALIAAEVPDELRPRKRYKKTPDVEVLEGWTDKRFSTRCGRVFVPVKGKGTVKRCSHCGEMDVTSAKHFKSSIEKVEEVTKKGKVKVKNKRVPNPCKAAGAVIEKVPAEVQMWDELLPFNANSSSQLIAYMKHFDHPVGKNKKDPEVDAADAAHLQELVGRFGDDFPLYQLALDLHKVRKARTTYMPTPDAAGMIHTTYTNTPWTWRFGSRALNLQNWGKRSTNKWAKVARLQIISRPGWVFVQADSSSAEAVIQGWYMADLQYIEKASKGIHTWLSTMKLGWDFNPETIEKVKAEHSDLYAAMKTTNYLINFGGSPYALHMGNKKMFPTKKSAEKMFDTIYALLPTLEAYHYNIRTLAHKQGYLVSPWNVKFDFFDVFTYARGRGGEILYTASGRPKLKLGKDGKAVVAAFPQHSNGMFSRENAVIIGRSEWRQYMPASFAVHDSYKLRVPKELEEKAVMFLADTLTRPIPQLGGLRLGCEVEVGENWGEFHEQKNPQGMKKVHAVTIDKQTLTHFPNFKEDLRKVAA